MDEAAEDWDEPFRKSRTFRPRSDQSCDTERGRMRTERLLIIAQDRELLERIPAAMTGAGYQVEISACREDGVRRAAEFRPDLILLDQFHDAAGPIETCRTLRAGSRTCRVVIVLVSTIEREPEIHEALDNGADDYVLRPLLDDRIIARCRVLLRKRRENSDAGPVVRVGDFTIDPAGYETRLAGKRLDLTPTEFRLLYALAGRPGWVLTREQILDAVRGQDCVVRDRAVDEQVLGLRRKLGQHGSLVETVRGVGYRFRTEQAE